MNNVDFLPQWYKENTRRRQGVQRQYIVLAALFLVMIVWNSVALRSIKRVSAEVSLSEPHQRQAEHASFEQQDLMNRIDQIEEMILSLERLDSRVDVAAVLAELSALIDSSVVLGRVAFFSTPYTRKGAAWTRAQAETDLSDPEALAGQLTGWAQICISLQGIAHEAGDVAELIRALEASSYFSQVHLKYSRHAAFGTQEPTDEEISGSRLSEGTVEFAIDCLLAHIERADDDG
jgi:Tfp pilus assembly protein PilN